MEDVRGLGQGARGEDGDEETVLGAGPTGLDDRLYTGVKVNNESRITSAFPDWANGKRVMATTGKESIGGRADWGAEMWGDQFWAC